MKKLLVTFTFLLFIVYLLSGPVNAQDQYVSCDLCGYCPGKDVPKGWTDCAKCIYPGISDPSSNQTVKVDPQTNAAPTPAVGKYYTMLGCLSTSVGSFTQAGAAGGVIQTLLNIVFSISGGITFLYLIYGSFLVMTSQADPERLNHGRRVIIGSVVGLFFVMASVFIVNIIATGVLQLPGFS